MSWPPSHHHQWRSIIWDFVAPEKIPSVACLGVGHEGILPAVGILGAGQGKRARSPITQNAYPLIPVSVLFSAAPDICQPLQFNSSTKKLIFLCLWVKSSIPIRPEEHLFCVQASHQTWSLHDPGLRDVQDQLAGSSSSPLRTLQVVDTNLHATSLLASHLPKVC